MLPPNPFINHNDGSNLTINGKYSYFTERNSTELWNGLGQSHIQALAMAQDINMFFLVLLFGKLTCKMIVLQNPNAIIQGFYPEACIFSL